MLQLYVLCSLRKSIRLNNWDYSNSGYYFVTVCSRVKGEMFGKAVGGNIILNDIGKVVWKCWREIPRHYDGCRLDKFVVMPDHVHGIVLIFDGGDRHACPVLLNPSNPMRLNPSNLTQLNPSDPGGSIPSESKKLNSKNITKRNNQRLPVIIGSFKSASAKLIHELNQNFYWQRSYFEEIIKSKKQYLNIKKYIKNNPRNY